MNDDDANPYQAPMQHSAPVAAEAPLTTRPNAGDWVVAVILGIVAAVVALPTSCIGMLFVASGLGGFVGESLIVWLLGGCLLITIAAGIFIPYLYIKTVRSNS